MNLTRSPLGHEYYTLLNQQSPLVSAITCCGRLVNTADRICPDCGKALAFRLVGTRHPESQKWRWLLYQEGKPDAPMGALTCAVCRQEITTANRQCSRCKAFYFLDYHREYTFPMEKRDPCGWALHLDATHDYEYAKQSVPGIRVVHANQGSSHRVRELPLDTSHLNLELGYLECPACGPFDDPRSLDHNNRCAGHKLDISAVLVRHPDGQISVERRAWNYIKQQDFYEILVEDDYNPIICRLACPRCDAPITDKQLKCVACGIIVDVGYERQPIQKASGAVVATYTQIKIKPRLLGKSERPEGLLAIEDAPTPEDVIAEIDEAKAAREAYEFYRNAKKLIDKYTWRAAAEKLDMSLGKLQHFMKNPPPKPTD